MWGESIFCRRLWNGAKTRSNCGWTTPNSFLKLSHGCVCDQLWINAAPIKCIAGPSNNEIFLFDFCCLFNIFSENYSFPFYSSIFWVQADIKLLILGIQQTLKSKALLNCFRMDLAKLTSVNATKRVRGYLHRLLTKWYC